MLLNWRSLLWAALGSSVSWAQTPESVDVVIVGGGASGAYAAVRLREDYKKSVLVVEKSNRLGGHVHAYQPPGGGRPVNYGVQAYLDRNTTQAFFDRFKVELIQPDFGSYIDLLFRTESVDFNTGLPVNVDYGPLDVVGIPVALVRYLDIVSEYQPWFENGYFQTGEVPEDLLLPFGEFLQKHDLVPALGILRALLWLSDTLDTPTWHVLAVVGEPQLRAFGLGLAGPAFKWPGTYSSETLFDNVLDSMKEDVLLESTVSSSNRTDDGVSLNIQTPNGQRVVNAKKLLIAATPSPDNTAPWDLDSNEQAMFAKFSWETLYVGVVGNTGLPLDNVGMINSPNNSADAFLPRGSFCDALIQNDGRDLYATRIIGTADLEAPAAQDIVFDSFNKMKQAQTFSIGSPSLVAFASHGLTVPKVTPTDLKAGFYNQLYDLQGKRSTYWTGLTWAPDYTPILWDFNEKLLPQIVDGI